MFENFIITNKKNRTDYSSKIEWPNEKVAPLFMALLIDFEKKPLRYINFDI